MAQSEWDVVVVGGGAAGLMACLELPPHLRVLLLNKERAPRSASRWAQGGIAAVTNPDDSFASHRNDTLTAGAGLCDAPAVELLVHAAPACVARLLELGMAFDRDGLNLSTTLEAAHSHRRVLHAQDRTGGALVDALEREVRRRPGLEQRQGVVALQLWVEAGRCCGLQLLEGGRIRWLPARAVVLATGGGGHLFAHTTNPVQSSGDGLAMAWQAGAELRDLEFVQFHPTALMLPGAPHFLISEAVRGEGARLLDGEGASPVAQLPGGDLAPRDQVSRALARRMREQGVDHLWLDLRPIGAEHLARQFPTILARCRELGLEPTRAPLPVAPAAHYWMGGVRTDLNAATTLRGLYAVGELACTGVHGANRLASNSLMECLVFARQLRHLNPEPLGFDTTPWQPDQANGDGHSHGDRNSHGDNRATVPPAPALGTLALKARIRRLRDLCWQVAGVERQGQALNEGLRNVRRERLELEADPCWLCLQGLPRRAELRIDPAGLPAIRHLQELHQRLVLAELLMEASAFRLESRGGHHRQEAPRPQPFWRVHSSQTRGQTIRTTPVS